MPNEIEWSRRWYKAINFRTGGSANGETYDGGAVSLSRFGEFACRIGDQGELLAIFPKKGVMCGYNDEKKLVFVSIDIACLLGSLDDKELAEMANEGRDIDALYSELDSRGQVLFLTVFPTIGRIGLETRDEKSLLDDSAIDDIDWSQGFEGTITFGETRLAYYAMQRGDEFVVSVGEQLDTRRTLVPISFSNKIDYMFEIESEDPKRYWRLADKIILNR